jgi:hypothetical protein
MSLGYHKTASVVVKGSQGKFNGIHTIASGCEAKVYFTAVNLTMRGFPTDWIRLWGFVVVSILGNAFWKGLYFLLRCLISSRFGYWCYSKRVEVSVWVDLC